MTKHIGDWQTILFWFQKVCDYFDELPNGHELPIYENILKGTRSDVLAYYKGIGTSTPIVGDDGLPDYIIRYSMSDEERQLKIRQEMKALSEDLQFDLTMRGLL